MVKAGDYLIRIDGRSCSELTASEATALITMSGVQIPPGTPRSSFRSKVRSRPKTNPGDRPLHLALRDADRDQILQAQPRKNIIKGGKVKKFGIGLTVLEHSPHTVTAISAGSALAQTHQVPPSHFPRFTHARFLWALSVEYSTPLHMMLISGDVG